MSEPIISVSGLRGIVGESLTPEIAVRYACAFAGATSGGHDRHHPRRPRHRSDAGRRAQGRADGARRDVIDADVAATPTTGVLVRRAQAAGGIQISASHNPPQYNGLKLFSPEGRVIPAERRSRSHRTLPRRGTRLGELRSARH